MLATIYRSICACDRTRRMRGSAMSTREVSRCVRRERGAGTLSFEAELRQAHSRTQHAYTGASLTEGLTLGARLRAGGAVGVLCAVLDMQPMESAGLSTSRWTFATSIAWLPGSVCSTQASTRAHTNASCTAAHQSTSSSSPPLRACSRPSPSQQHCVRHSQQTRREHARSPQGRAGPQGPHALVVLCSPPV